MACMVTPSLGEIFLNCTKGAFKQGTAASSSQVVWMCIPLGIPPSADDSNSLRNLTTVSWSEPNLSCAAIDSQSIIKLYRRQRDSYPLAKQFSYSKPHMRSISRLQFHRIFCTCINLVRP